MNENYAVEMIDISKAFSGVTVLNGVDLRLKKGSVHALVGENGAGKSTLMKILTGMYSDYGGTIVLEGTEVRFGSEREALQAGIAIVAQELTPIAELTIAENIFLGREPQTRVKGVISYRRLFDQTKELMTKLGLSYDPRTKMKELSVAETQMVEIIKAISRNSKIIVMDEPTSALTNAETEYLFRQIDALKAQGIAIVFISHKFDEIFRVCDTVTVLRDGKFIGTHPIGELTQDKIVAMMVGREITDIYPPLEEPGASIAFEVSNLTRKGEFEDVSFRVRQGEIVGISGIMGAGRTEVARTIFGLDRPDSGNFNLMGQTVTIRSPEQAIRLGIAMASEDRKNLGFVGVRSIKDNIALPNMDIFSRWAFILRNKLNGRASEISGSLAVKATSLDMPVSQLSGGNQQKVVLAKWLVRDIKLLILDEPTRGIDVGAKAEIYKLMRDLARQGIPIIMISSELPEVIGMSHRVLVMAEGRIQGELSRGEAMQENIMKLIVNAKKDA
ncbi:sugar ABC transporter ATP-binding protein [Cohnella faecalis]|uniref:Sugar ABC transporter ATP-binding protein n=1 Tax=Cohnella faecalis TaxID=2315694 RepID=A0A398CMW2_9BACL|nr:sugar ABC transporter ATP-binding protein [Cohnella faecalis]RIE00921.1 sugar ABC transporter ATP-binding protein [Cohnella faecalis]